MAFLRWAPEWVVRKVLVDTVEPMRGKAGATVGEAKGVPVT
jgi:hypothetical protein